jgi:hypothetical protein
MELFGGGWGAFFGFFLLFEGFGRFDFFGDFA